MAANREGTGLTILRVAVGVFLLCEGLARWRWLLDAGPLSARLAEWTHGAGSIARWYLHTVAVPGAAVLARLVVLGEVACGAALTFGVWTRLAAALGFLMVLNFHLASGALFHLAFLTNGYGLPVLGGLLALAVGGARLPWSLRG